MGVNLQPDDPITSIRVVTHTADKFAAGTDDNIYIRLIEIPKATKAYQFRLTGNGSNRFEVNSTDTSWAPASYFAGFVVNDISIVQLYKDADSIYGGWAFDKIEIYVNEQPIYATPEGQSVVWLEDESPHRHWTAPDFHRVEFTNPKINGTGKIQAKPGGAISHEFSATGGRLDLKWNLAKPTTSGWSPPTITIADKRRILLSGVGGPDGTIWQGTLSVTDADGRSSSKTISIASLSKLPAPTISDISPEFGWVDAPPAGPGATLVTITGSSFDARVGQTTRVFFTAAAGGTIEAKVAPDMLWENMVTVPVPTGAATGPIQVVTATGTGTSSETFTVHPSGYRFASGFAFVNTISGGEADGFPDEFSWDRYVEAYGKGEMYLFGAFDEVVPSPKAEIFYHATRDLIGNGCCHGFAMTSLRFRQRIISDYSIPVEGNPYPLEWSLFDKSNGASSPAPAMSHLIQVGQLAMMSSEALSFYTSRLVSIGNVAGAPNTMDARPMLQDVRDELSRGWIDPRMIAFSKAWNPLEGHVVVAHAESNNQVHVYNPNSPAKREGPTNDPISHFDINPITGNWSFKFDTVNAPWHGKYCFTIPLSAYGHQGHWSLVTVAELFNAAIAYFGSCVPGPGTTVEPLNGLQASPVMAPRPIHMMNAKSVRLRVTSSDKPGLVSLMLDSGVALSVEEIHGTVLIDLDLTAQTFQITEEALLSDVRPVARAVRHEKLDPVARTYAVRASAGTPRGQVGLAWKKDEMRLLANVAAIDLHTRRVDQLARDDAVELIALPKERVTNALVTMLDDGAPHLTDAGGLPVDLTSIKRYQPRLPTHVSTLDEIAPAIRANGRVDGSSSGRVSPLDPKVDPRKVPNPRIPIDPTHGRVVVPPVVPRMPLKQTVDLGTANGSAIKVRSATKASAQVTSNGRLQLSVPAGNRRELLVEEAAGYRTFPRSMMISTPEPDARSMAAHVILAEAPGIVQTGAKARSASVPITLVVGNVSVNAATIDFAPRKRRCGPGVDQPAAEPDFALSQAMQALGATVTKTSRGRGGVTVAISWPPAAAQSGRLALGSLIADVPDLPGSAWTIGGYAYVTTREGQEVDARVVPIELRCQSVSRGRPPIRDRGGRGPISPPRGPFISAAKTVAQGEKVLLSVSPLPDGVTAVGWWSTSMGGQIEITQQNGTEAQAKGILAGPVRISAMVGDQILHRTICIQAVAGWSPLDAEETPQPPIPSVPARTFDPSVATLSQRFRDPIWNPDIFSSRVDLGKGITFNPGSKMIRGG